jgi:hypothetical protein
MRRLEIISRRRQVTVEVAAAVNATLGGGDASVAASGGVTGGATDNGGVA